MFQNRIHSIQSDNDPSLNDSLIKELIESGIDVLVSIGNYDFNLSWTAGNTYKIRRYQCTFGNYPYPSDWELRHLNEFFLYELAHDRRVAVWCEDSQVDEIVRSSVNDFFDPGDTDFPSFIKEQLALQPARAETIPPKLTHCKACREKSCLTNLVCHVSSVGSAKKILETGTILSAVQARQKTGPELAKEPGNAAGDPPDYFKYVMFTFGNCTAGDNLVMERRLERNPTRIELVEEFTPGVRFYFRYHDLIRHPGFRSDGYHYCKIKDSINLEDHLLVVIAPGSARQELLSGSPVIQDKLVFPDETAYSDLYSWSQKAYTTALEYGKIS